MKNKNIQSIDNYLKNSNIKSKQINNLETEECDMNTGECYIIRTKDGIVERINKKYITEDGKTLLID